MIGAAVVPVHRHCRRFRFHEIFETLCKQICTVAQVYNTRAEMLKLYVYSVIRVCIAVHTY